MFKIISTKSKSLKWPLVLYLVILVMQSTEASQQQTYRLKLFYAKFTVPDTTLKSRL